MALQVTVYLQASLPDGTQVANVIRGRLTFNPQGEDAEAEKALAMAAARSQSEAALEEFEESLDDWATAIQRVLDANRQQQGGGS
jgi:hypothetical protein